MTLVFVTLTIGLGLVILLWSLYSRKDAELQLLEEPAARLLPPVEVVQALFDPDDRDFVAQENSAELMRLLENGRRAVALHWLSKTKQEAMRAIREYRMSARHEETISVAGELRMFRQMVSFLSLNLALAVTVRWVSVFHVHGLLGRLDKLSRPLLDYMPASRFHTAD